MKIGELFAGIGGIGLGFKQAGFDVAWAIEQNKKAMDTYRANFPHARHYPYPTQKIDIIGDCGTNAVMSLSDGCADIDVLTAGFPCQAFSIAGKQEGFDDERGNVFFEVIRFLKRLQPKAVFLENVKNLVSHDKGRTFATIKAELEAIGYHLTYKVMNTAHYTDVPQHRERIYIIGFKDVNHANAFVWPTATHNVRGIRELLDGEAEVKYWYTPDFRHYDTLRTAMTNPHTLYQWRRTYVRENKSNLCPTLTANMGTGGHNVPMVLEPEHDIIRKLTPRECARFQGFPDDFVLPATLSDAALYKQIGNSVSVPVVKLLADEIRRVLND